MTPAQPLEVWGRATSSNVQAVMWCIAELGLPYKRHDIGHRFGGNDTAEFAALNPNRTVPVLRDAPALAIWESGAILRYLASRYGPEGFWPADSARRSVVDQWAEWAKINIALGFTAPVFWRVVRTPSADRDPQAIDRAVKALDQKLTIANDQLKNNAFIVGDTLTLADIQLGHILHRYYDISITRADLPALRQYYDRLTERQPYAEHVMVSYADLALD